MRFVFLFAVVLKMGLSAFGQAPAQDQRTQNPPTSETTTQPPAARAPATPDASTAPPADTTVIPEKKLDVAAPKTLAKRRKRPAPTPGQPRKVVVREGGTSEPAAQIAPDMTPAEAARQRQSAELLLGTTGDHLRQLDSRTLNTRQQETVEQIKNYMNGARAALKEGDVHRASTLAEKGNELAQDLLRH
jgi:outer membrane biosynthesis protein TonB